MKRLIAVIISVLTLISSNIVFADTIGDLRAIKALPTGFDGTTEEYITRAEFAYMTTKILSREERAPQETIFADVTSENEYSGYIDYLADMGIVSGVDGAMFNPDAHIDTNAANKILVNALGYTDIAERFGGYPEGYNKLAWDLSLYDDVASSYGKLTKVNAAQIIHNALLADVRDEYSENGIRPLCDVLDISAYRGTFIDTDISSNTGVFNVTKNVYGENHRYLQTGKDYVFSMVRTENITQYERIPAVIWVDNEDKIVNVIPDKNVKVLYGYGYSVNGNEDADALYPVKNISTFCFVNDEEEYDVSEDIIVKYNNKYTDAHVKLCGNFVKAVMYMNEIIFMESFSLQEGGIITKKAANEIVYTQSLAGTKRINNVLLKKNVKVFIDNVPGDYADLGVNDVFDYYETDDDLTIVATQNLKRGTLEEYSVGDSVNINGMFYDIDGAIYFSADGSFYDTNADLSRFINKDVVLYLAPSGYARYITLAEDFVSNEFYGIVVGFEEATYTKNAEIKMYKVEGKKITEAVYSAKDKIKFDGVPVEVNDIKQAFTVAVSNKETGNSLYKFKVNTDDMIVSVSSAKYFNASESFVPDAKIAVESDGSGTMNIPWDNTFVRISSSMPITYIHTDENGKFHAANVTYADLSSWMTNIDLNVKFFGDEKTEYPDVTIAYGTMGVSSTLYYGIYTGIKSTVVDEAGDKFCRVGILTSSGEQTYLLPENYAKSDSVPTGNALVTYRLTTGFFDERPMHFVSNLIDLSSSRDEWLNENGDTLMQGVIDRIVGHRVYFKDGTTKIFEASDSKKLFVAYYDDRTKNRFVATTKDEIHSGDLVYYKIRSTAKSGIISGMIVVR